MTDNTDDRAEIAAERDFLKSLLARATGFYIGRARTGGRIRVEGRGGDLWAVTDDGFCLDRTGHWIYEPLPSSRTEEFIADTRYGLKEALELAEKSLTAEPEIL